jgi:guanine nucleotide-binding protein G(I)/G(S)/G(T) subunit beta-1
MLLAIILQGEVKGLKAELERLHSRNDEMLNVIWSDIGHTSSASLNVSFAVARRMMGHTGKVKAVAWGSSTLLASASQDGRVFVWDALTNARTLGIKLESAWVMTCGYEQTRHKFLASGGLDNKCTLYDTAVTTATVSEPVSEFGSHEGYLSRVKFLGESRLLTASGDSTCCLWDIATTNRLEKFEDHAADVQR